MEVISKVEQILGTEIEIKLPKESQSFFPFCFNLAREIENKYSRFKNNNTLEKINKNLNRWQKVDEETFFLIEKSLELSIKTDGNFDISVKKALERIGYDLQYSFIEKNEEEERIEDPIQINREKNEVFLKKEIEFGGIGKGYFLDKAAEFLKNNKIENFYINAGGDIIANSKKDPWPILLEHPDNSEMAIGKINLNGKSIAASAANKRKWGKNHHLINAKTRKPANNTKAIFVIAETAIEADCYATALFCAGFNEGIEIGEKLPIDFLIISNENKMYKSENFEVEFFE